MRFSTSPVNGCKIASAGAVVMAVVPEKLRSGIVELRTNRGLLYASPSFWERLYLLWTFRNFHRLPQQVLNRHQQQVIERLCRTAVVARPGSVAYGSLIGSVENLKLDVQTEPAAASAGMVVSMSAHVPAVPKAVGSEPASSGRNRRFEMPTRLISFPGQRRTSAHTSRPALHRERLTQSSQRLLKQIACSIPATWRQQVVGVGAVILCSVIALGILVQLREKRLKAPAPAPHHMVAVSNSPLPGTPTVQVAKPAKIQAPAPVQRSEPKPKVALAASEPAIGPPAPAQSELKEGGAATTPVRQDSAERLSFAEPPESGFGYPAAPNANLTGKVILNALVGTDGTVTRVEVLSGNRFLAKAAVQEVRRWRYAPHKVDGTAVQAETHIVFNFQGEDAVSISFPPN